MNHTATDFSLLPASCGDRKESRVVFVADTGAKDQDIAALVGLKANEKVQWSLGEKRVLSYFLSQQRNISPRMRRTATLIVRWMMLPLALIAFLEVLVRLAGLGQPFLRTVSLAEENAGILRFDQRLFWALRPGFRGIFEGRLVTVNEHGHRGAETLEKGTNEFRILSLGESSTFGVNVSDMETYSARLADLLNSGLSSSRFTVVNAGVPAYSSFQSVKFLESRGLKLKPDLVLFYHELNDYLPSSLRDSSQNELGVTRTDKELYESRARRVSSFFIAHSALFRFVVFADADRRIQRFNTNDVRNPLAHIGVKGIGLPPRVYESSRLGLNEVALGRRVSDDERRAHLHQLVTFCRKHGIGLILIHPSYEDSLRHECLLTQFCRENKVAMFEAFDSLHPDERARGSLFSDSWHPNAEGHRRLAEDLAAFIIERGFHP